MGHLSQITDLNNLRHYELRLDGRCNNGVNTCKAENLQMRNSFKFQSKYFIDQFEHGQALADRTNTLAEFSTLEYAACRICTYHAEPTNTA